MAKSPGNILLFLILFGTMFVIGYVENIKGVSYPLIKTELGVSYEQQGIMVSVLSFSFVLFCFVGGIIIGSFGAKRALITGFAAMSLGIIFVVIPPLLKLPGFLSVAALFFVVASFGLLEVSSNALAAHVFTSKAALLLSLLHFFYGAGSSLSPRAAGAIAAVLDWRKIYLFSLPLVMIFFIPSVFCRFPGEKDNQAAAGEIKKYRFLAAFKSPMVWFFSIVLGLMVSVETCSINWAGLYFQDVYNMDPKTSGAAFISNFFIFFTLSRLVSGFAIEKMGYMRSLFIASVTTSFIFLLGFILGAKGIHVLPLVGFFIAIFWPTILAISMGYFREDAPVMSSAIIVISGAVNSVIQFLIGMINRLIGPAWGYRSCLVYAVIIIAALVVLAKRLNHPYKTWLRNAAG